MKATTDPFAVLNGLLATLWVLERAVAPCVCVSTARTLDESRSGASAEHHANT